MWWLRNVSGFALPRSCCWLLARWLSLKVTFGYGRSKSYRLRHKICMLRARTSGTPKTQSFPKVQVELLGRTFCVDQQLFKETNGRGVINSTINCWISISNLLNLNLERKTNTVYKQNMQVQILRTISKYQLTSRYCYVSSLDRLWTVSGPSLWSVSLGRLIIRCPGTPLYRDDLRWTLLGGRSRDFKN
jgi:hypothetical protein